MSFYNTHTHIFNVPCVPDAFITNYRFPQFVSGIIRYAVHKKWARTLLLGFLKRIPIRVGGVQIRRYAALVEVAINRYQSEVFEELRSNYATDARFVLLTMNFDYMTGEAPAGNYNHYDTQLHEALEVKSFYADKALPFLFIDPRMGENECMNLLHFYFDPARNRGITGIKIYPSLGYYPFHPNMEKVYAFAEEHQIPIITHTYKSGGAYYSGRFTPAMLSYNSFNQTPETTAFLNAALIPFPSSNSSQEFANILMHPMTYYDVMRKFPKLKICFAHFGGTAELLNQDDPSDTYNWTRTIKKLMKEFENVYTDVSFTLKDRNANKIILNDMTDPVLSKKILFGTDFFLTTPFDTDRALTENFFQLLAPYMTQLTVTNPTRFLTSAFFT